MLKKFPSKTSGVILLFAGLCLVQAQDETEKKVENPEAQAPSATTAPTPIPPVSPEPVTETVPPSANSNPGETPTSTAPGAMPELAPILSPDENTPSSDSIFSVEPDINLVPQDQEYPLALPNAPTATAVYPVAKFILKYAPEGRVAAPGLPPIESLTEAPMMIGKSGDTLVPAGTGTEDLQISINNLPPKAAFTPDGLREVFAEVQKRLNAKNIYGVLVAADPVEIDADSLLDKRNAGPDANSLNVLVYVGEIKQLRTITRRPPFRNSDLPTIDAPKFARIKTQSPIQPGSLLDKGKLEDYLARVNRFPGRRVDVAINASGEPGGVILDYLVREARPWTVFLQTSNTGTESTGDYRTQIGAEYRQLAQLDDILAVDYTTSDFSSSNNLNASYQVTPIFPDVLKAKVYGSYGNFTASDVGFDFQNFEGETWKVGALLTWTPIRFWDLPLDITLGAEWVDVQVSNQSFGADGHGEFFMPYIGLGTEKKTDTSAFYVNLRVLTNIPEFTSTTDADLSALGRFDADNEFYTMQFSLGTNFFIEPLLLGKKFRTPNDPKSWTLAHELSFTGRGQYTFGDRRLIPQFEDTVGGFYTVRGYPESLAAGDNIYVGTAEYKLHIPRLLAPWKPPVGAASDAGQTIGKLPFALKPQIAGEGVQLPDWDLIFRLFVDVGYNENNRLQSSSEVNRTLVGVGAGLEFQIKNNLSLRMDYGIAMTEQRDLLTDPVNEGDARLHISAAIVW